MEPKKITQELVPVENQTTELEIVDSLSLSLATELLSNLNKTLDEIIKEKKKILDPLNEARKAEQDRWKPIEERLGGLIGSIRAKMGVYQTKTLNAIQRAEEAIASRVGEGSGKYLVTTALKKLGELDKPLEEVKTASGSLKFRATPVLKIVDREAIPHAYWTVDEDLVFADLKAGKGVKGAEIEIIQVPVNRRN